jgi:predicted short-subunit dehydrogenase-like oxidoreductase (DUF2520 family)
MFDRIAIVGRGRLGRTLAPLLSAAGRRAILLSRGEPLPPGWGSDAAVLLCVPDVAVRAVAEGVAAGPVVAHCSGALDLDVLASHPVDRRGSLHPLMTFPGPEVAVPDLRDVPAAVAGEGPALAAVTEIALALGMRPFAVPGDRRLYHAAAVMAGNFATVLLAEAAGVLAAAGVAPAEAPGLLARLATASIRNAASSGADPGQALTGPIARGDRVTLDAHRAALRDHGLNEVLELYETLVKHGVALRRLPDRVGVEEP